MTNMSSISLPDFENDVRTALARVLGGESLLVVEGNRQIAQITPAPASAEDEPERGSLVEFFLNSPLRDSGITIDRDPSGERETPVF